MHHHDLAARAESLRAAREPFVHARVVLAERPTSAKPGDEAIILADWTVEGFVGGTCAESTVREEALALLEAGGTLMLCITPDPAGAASAGEQPGKRVVHNPCLSGGTIEVYLEADVPAPLVVVTGRAPIAAAVTSLAAALGWDVRDFEGSLPGDTSAVVVASHGRGEEKALLAALDADVPYVALVASRRRGRAVVDSLPVGEDRQARVRTPAGLDIGAKTAGEVALSILAEVVASGQGSGVKGPRTAAVPLVRTAIDPVCGMPVLPGDSALSVRCRDETVWFCGSGCLRAFTADPIAYKP
ncbi:MAG: XdhC family protein [Acidimicrobiales bacterium]